jgi:hypothetical protein
MKPALNEFVFAGFYVTRLVARPSYVSSELMPEHILSLSGCLANFIPDTWCIEWSQDTQGSRLEEAETFELDSTALGEVTKWVTPQFDTHFAWPNTITDPDFAIQLVKRFLSTLPDVRILEIALHLSQMEQFCCEAKQFPQQPGSAPTGRQGILDAALRMQPVTEGGRVLGFEPLVYDYTLSCSWLCNSLDTLVAERLNIRPNSYGFISSFDDACKCVEYISREEVGAEPGLWLPWLIIDRTDLVQQ